jgi:hypothetical protein
MVHWESLLERDAIMLFEFSPGVASYREQPFSTHYFFEGKMRRYTPDFEVTFQCGSVQLIEVKPYSKLENADMQQRFDAIRSHFNSQGLPFAILNDRQIRRKALLKNLFTIYSYRTPSLSRGEVRLFEEILLHVSPLTFGSAVKALGTERAFWQLVAVGKISVQLEAEIHACTPFAINKEILPNEKLYF